MFKIDDGKSCFFQWDLNRKLIVEDSSIPEVYFSNRTSEQSLVCETFMEGGNDNIENYVEVDAVTEAEAN